MPESLFKSLFKFSVSLNFIKKETLTHGFSCEFCKIFKSISFTEHLCMTASILQQLLALYFAITHSWQLSSSEKSLVWKKFHPYFQGFYRFRFLLHRFFSFSVTQNVWCALSSRLVSETTKHNAFDKF